MSEETIFSNAIEKKTPEERDAYLDAACAEDRGLRERVEALLAAHENPDSFLDPPDAGEPETEDYAPIAEGPGTVIGPYKLLEKIGEGGMGVVYMAEQTRPVKMRVALKIIKPGMDSKQVIARFETERQALALMDHPNIAKVLAAGTTGSGRPYFAMELVKGEPITTYCDKHRLTLRERLRLFVSVCLAVQHAHQKGIIHRDLKPSNVLIARYDGNPVAKVIDFGVAKATGQQLTEKTLFTRYGQVVGTLEYMSPEQAEFNQQDIDTRSDIYSLGILLYQLLAGTTPFDPERLRSGAWNEVMRIIREEEPPRPSVRVSSAECTPSITAQNCSTDPGKLLALLRGDLDWLVMKALEKERERRYETASALAADIERYLDGDAIEARPPSSAYRLRKFGSRHKGPVAAALAIAIVLVAGIVATSAVSIRAVGEARRADQEAKRAKEYAGELEAKKDELQKMLVELRGELMDKALAAVTSGDTRRAEAAIDRARKAEVPEGWIRIFQGQLALYSGKTDKAIQLLQQEAENSVAAHGMLAVAYFFDGRMLDYELAMGKLRERSPETPEDHLFAGQAWSFIDVEKALEMVEHAVTEHNSPLARAIYAKVKATKALQAGGDPKAIESALRDIEAARSFVGDTPFLLTIRLFVQYAAIKTEYVSLSPDLIHEAREIADTVKSLPVGRVYLIQFFADIGDYEFAEQVWASSNHKSDFETIAYIPVALQWKSPEEVLELVEGLIRFPGPYSRCATTMVMALVPEKRAEARRICEEQLRCQTSYAALAGFVRILLLLDGANDVRSKAAAFSDSWTTPYSSSQRAMEYIASPVDPEVYLEGMGRLPGRWTEVCYTIAVSQLAEGNRDEAVRYFERCTERGAFGSVFYWWANALPKYMDEHPDWPQAVPAGRQVE